MQVPPFKHGLESQAEKEAKIPVTKVNCDSGMFRQVLKQKEKDLYATERSLHHFMSVKRSHASYFSCEIIVTAMVLN